MASCVVPENTNTHPKKGFRKFQGGGRSQKPKCLNESVNQNWNFQREGSSNQKALVGGGWIIIFNSSSTLHNPKV